MDYYLCMPSKILHLITISSPLCNVHTQHTTPVHNLTKYLPMQYLTKTTVSLMASASWTHQPMLCCKHASFCQGHSINLHHHGHWQLSNMSILQSSLCWLRTQQDTQHATKCCQSLFLVFVCLSNNLLITVTPIIFKALMVKHTFYCLDVCHYSICWILLVQGSMLTNGSLNIVYPVPFLINMFKWIGGELGCCFKIINLFESAIYFVKITALDSLHQNGPGEWPHCTIGDAIQIMLAGTGLGLHFWPYSFHHFLHL